MSRKEKLATMARLEEELKEVDAQVASLQLTPHEKLMRSVRREAKHEALERFERWRATKTDPGNYVAAVLLATMVLAMSVTGIAFLILASMDR